MMIIPTSLWVRHLTCVLTLGENHEFHKKSQHLDTDNICHTNPERIHTFVPIHSIKPLTNSYIPCKKEYIPDFQDYPKSTQSEYPQKTKLNS